MSILRMRLTMPDGEVAERDWAAPLHSFEGPPPEPPPWMRNPSRSWAHPRDPITLSADVLEGFEETAREWLAALP